MTFSITRLSRQSWFRINDHGFIIDIDPAYYGSRKPGGSSAEKADLILVTHDHPDHFDARAISDLSGPETLVAGPEACVSRLAGRTKTVRAHEEFSAGVAYIRAVDAYNLGLRGLLLHRKEHCFGYLVKLGGRVVYHAGDTDFIPEMKAIGHVDVAFLPISGLMNMSPVKAVEAVKAFRPDMVVPMHELLASPKNFKRKLEAAVPDVKVVLLGVGQELVL